MFSQSDLLPYLRHRLTLLDLRPMFQEERHLNLSRSSASIRLNYHSKALSLPS